MSAVSARCGLLGSIAALVVSCGERRDRAPASTQDVHPPAIRAADANPPGGGPHVDASASDQDADSVTAAPRACSGGTRAVHVMERRGDHVAVCFDGGAECWRASLDASAPRIEPLARPDWPSALRSGATTTTTAAGPSWVSDPPAEGPDELELPAGWTVRVIAPAPADPDDADDGPPITGIELCRPGGCAPLALAPLRRRQAALAGHIQGVHVAADGAQVAVTRGAPRTRRTLTELYELPSGRRIAVLSSRARALSPVSAGGQCTRPVRWLGPRLLIQESDCEWPGDYYLHDAAGRRLATLPFAVDDATPATWHDAGDGRWVVSSAGTLTGFDTGAGRRLPVREVRPDRDAEVYGDARVIALQPGGDLMVAWGDAELFWIDRQLRTRARAAPPRCPPP